MTNVAPQPVVEIEQRGAVAIIRLSRPERLNAFNIVMRDEIIAAFDRCDAEDSIRAVVLTGAGRAFCAGADLETGTDTFELDDHGTGLAPADWGGEVSLRVYRSIKPVIVAYNGPAAGVGITMTLPADIRIASDTAKFAFIFTRRGLVPEGCSSWFLPRTVGINTALEWTMGGKTITAAEALESGLIREIVPVDQVLDRAIEVATDLTEGTPPVSVALTRQLMWRMLAATGPEVAHAAESEAIYVRGTSDDVHEGVQSFLDKRPPHFPQRLSDGLPDIFP
jgi:enoyl-CoA hydratase/carnithine racemase